MTVQEFLREFDQAQEVFRWECLDDGAIRGMLHSGTVRAAFDPITAVLFARDSDDTLDADRVRAAERLGLSSLDSTALRDAADGEVWKQIDGETALDGYSEWLRTSMLASAGLDLDSAVAGTPLAAAPPAGVPLEPEPQLQHF